MPLAPYRRLLALPGVRSLLGVALLARIPISAAPMAVNLHVLLGLGSGYTAAAVVGVALTVGMTVGGPLFGRLVDSRGLRLVLAVTTIGEGLFWLATPWLPYPLLVMTAVLGGLVHLPVQSITRQALATLVPEPQRRTAYSLDSIVVELAFMVGPALAVVLATRVSTTTTLLLVGGCVVAAGIGLYLLNPPVKTAADTGPKLPRPSLRSWLSPSMVAVLVASSGAVLVLAGTDLAVVATLNSVGEVEWTSVVIPAWCLASLVGGFVYGAMHRSVPPLVLMGLLGVFTLVAGFAGNWWSLCLLLIPAGALCAPTIAATADEVSTLAPESVRGAAMGLHGSALTVGGAIGAPLAGAVIDHVSPAAGFLVVGGTGAVLALLATLIQRRAAHRPQLTAPGPPARDVNLS